MAAERKHGFAGVVQAIVSWLQGETATSGSATKGNNASPDIEIKDLKSTHAIVAKSLQSGKVTTSIPVLRHPKPIPRPASPAEVGTFKPPSLATEDEKTIEKPTKTPSVGASK